MHVLVLMPTPSCPLQLSTTRESYCDTSCRTQLCTWLSFNELGVFSCADLAAGAKQHAVGFSTLQDVQRVDVSLTALADAHKDPSTPQPLITVVGAGYAGVELAATIAERMRGAAAVQLLSPSGEVLPVWLDFILHC